MGWDWGGCEGGGVGGWGEGKGCLYHTGDVALVCMMPLEGCGCWCLCVVGGWVGGVGVGVCVGGYCCIVQYT